MFSRTSGHDSVVLLGGGQRSIRWLLQAPLPLEREYLPAALQGIPGVLCAVRLCQCLLQVKAFTCVCS